MLARQGNLLARLVCLFTIVLFINRLISFFAVVKIYLEARKFSRGTICRPCVAYGGTSVGHQLNDIQRGCNILIATPGRLMDFVGKGRVSVKICGMHVLLIVLFL